MNIRARLTGEPVSDLALYLYLAASSREPLALVAHWWPSSRVTWKAPASRLPAGHPALCLSLASVAILCVARRLLLCPCLALSRSLWRLSNWRRQRFAVLVAPRVKSSELLTHFLNPLPGVSQLALRHYLSCTLLNGSRKLIH